jgi:sugar fermentation stimulation protein A
MKYLNIEQARFKERPNRFIAYVETAHGREICHVKNTGRCKELLREDAVVYVQRNDNPARKTKLDLIGVEKPPYLINMDSQIVNDAAEEWLRKGTLVSPGATIRREVTYGASRFDFYLEDGERRIFMEVKGVTLENGGIASFPDAPTERGVKHLYELIDCLEEGYEAYVLFVIQMKGIHAFYPNDTMHPAFGEALRKAKNAGVRILVKDCEIHLDSIVIDGDIPLIL